MERKKNGTLERIKSVLLGIGVTVSVTALLVGFFVLAMLISRTVRNWIERRIEDRIRYELSYNFQVSRGDLSRPQTETLKPPEPKPEENLVSGTFTDSFSSAAWLDTDLSTMRLDKAISALTLPPEVEWRPAPNSGIRFIERGEAGKDTRCIGSRCLVEQEGKLFFGEMPVFSPLPLPAELAGKRVVRVGISALAAHWIIGATLEANGGYEGRIYWFDGASFSRIAGDRSLSTSKYEGVFGFGGTEDDWLALYGAYEGIGYHMKGGEPQENISHLFGARPMSGGFQPVIVHAPKGLWYIGSLTENRPKLFKLWSDASGRITGALDLIVPEVEDAAAIRLANRAEGSGIYLKLIRTAPEVWMLEDHGFDASKSREVVSLSVVNAKLGKFAVRRAAITSVTMKGGENVQFLLSNDGRTWQEARVGEEVTFPNPDGADLFWKAVFPKPTNSRISPFFDQIRIEYKLKFQN